MLEIKGERERKGKTPKPTESEGELAIFSMMRFDTATSIFLALLVIKSNREKVKVHKTKRHQNFAVKKHSETNVCLWSCSNM